MLHKGRLLYAVMPRISASLLDEVPVCLRHFKNTKFYTVPIHTISLLFSIGVYVLFWLIYPFEKIKIAPIVAMRLGHLVAGPETFLRKRQIAGLPEKTWYVFLAGRSANRQLLTMWKRYLPVVESRVLYGLWHRSEWFWSKTRFYHSLWHTSTEYYEFHNARPTLVFTPTEEERGRAFLRQHGLRHETDWFVCVYARDDKYLKVVMPNSNFSYHDYRNADINTFHLAIGCIIERGGYVFRMGQHVDRSLQYQHSKVIDYATHFRDDFIDIYLAAKCRFFMGSLSGISDVAMLFDTPRLGINNAPLGNSPYSRNSLFIPKKVKCIKTDRYVPFKEVFEATTGKDNQALWSVYEFAKIGYKYEDDTPEEIRDVTIEMLDRLEGRFVESCEDRDLQDEFFRLIPSNHQGYGIKVPIGREFLRKYKCLLG